MVTFTRISSRKYGLFWLETSILTWNLCWDTSYEFQYKLQVKKSGWYSQNDYSFTTKIFIFFWSLNHLTTLSKPFILWSSVNGFVYWTPITVKPICFGFGSSLIGQYTNPFYLSSVAKNMRQKNKARQDNKEQHSTMNTHNTTQHTRQCKTMQDKTRPNKTRQDKKTRQNKTEQTTQDKATQGKTSQ